MQKTTNNGTGPVRVAMDAMGGDHGPAETVKGSLAAAKAANAEIILVGDLGPVEQELAKHDTSGISVRVVPSEDKIRDDEHPLQAMRTKPKSSVVVATKLVKSGDADVMVSNGFHDIDDHVLIADVAAVDEIGFEKFIMDGVTAGLGFGPGPDFLGQTAVIGMAALVIGKAFRLHQAFHACVLGFDFFGSATKQFL